MLSLFAASPEIATRSYVALALSVSSHACWAHVLCVSLFICSITQVVLDCNVFSADAVRCQSRLALPSMCSPIFLGFDSVSVCCGADWSRTQKTNTSLDVCTRGSHASASRDIEKPTAGCTALCRCYSNIAGKGRSSAFLELRSKQELEYEILDWAVPLSFSLMPRLGWYTSRHRVVSTVTFLRGTF